MIRTVGRPVGLTVMGVGVLSGSAISVTVPSHRTAPPPSAHLDPCDVLIASPLGPLMALTI